MSKVIKCNEGGSAMASVLGAIYAAERDGRPLREVRLSAHDYDRIRAESTSARPLVFGGPDSQYIFGLPLVVCHED